MLNGKIYEVIIPDELELTAHNSKMSRESFLEKILNEYAEAGYCVSAVWRDIIIMENFDLATQNPPDGENLDFEDEK